MEERKPAAFPYDDYVQSANALFHCMKEGRFLESILERRAIVPRYCIEDMGYLDIRCGDIVYHKMAVLQKCFCDIPLHKLMDTFELRGYGEAFQSLSDEEKLDLTQNNTHPDFYGTYAIAFSKKWGEDKHLQPVQYINEKSDYAVRFSEYVSDALGAEELPEHYSDDVLYRLSFVKSLRGIMSRQVLRKGENQRIQVDIWKNFHDEKEWRFVPDNSVLDSMNVGRIIANPSILDLDGAIDQINENLESEKYRQLWLEYEYNDIRYIIVPDSEERLKIISKILNIPDSNFDNPEIMQREKYILISKILVLNEIRKDW